MNFFLICFKMFLIWLFSWENFKNISRKTKMIQKNFFNSYSKTFNFQQVFVFSQRSDSKKWEVV